MPKVQLNSKLQGSGSIRQSRPSRVSKHIIEFLRKSHERYSEMYRILSQICDRTILLWSHQQQTRKQPVCREWGCSWQHHPSWLRSITSLVSHLQIQLQTFDAGFSASFDTYSNRITISHSTTNFELKWVSSSDYTAELLGFDGSANDTGSSSYTGDCLPNLSIKAIQMHSSTLRQFMYWVYVQKWNYFFQYSIWTIADNSKTMRWTVVRYRLMRFTRTRLWQTPVHRLLRTLQTWPQTPLLSFSSSKFVIVISNIRVCRCCRWQFPFDYIFPRYHI